MGEVEGLEQKLRSLSPFPAELPSFDPAEVPAEPSPLFVDWLDQAIAAGIQAPHTATLSTAGSDGRVSARTLILRGIESDGWVFSSHAESQKGRDLESNPHAALTFFWPALGRQVRVAGSVRTLSDERSANDFLARPEAARASSFIGHQSDPLESMEAYAQAEADALATIQEDPQTVADDWRCYAVVAETVEFWQAAANRAHIRLRYRLGSGSWSRELLWP